jgi:trk system potassium uptake protein TrkH
LFFEAVSAFSTTGISTAGTVRLDTWSKLLLAVTMFIGRVGPISFALALSTKTAATDNNKIIPEGKINIGQF